MKKWDVWWIRLEFKPQDMWVGVYWKVTEYEPCQGYHVPTDLDIWVCFLPTIPVHIHFKERGE